MNVPPIPTNLDAALARWLRDFTLTMERELARKVTSATPQASALLVSPNGSVYTVAVGDTGLLTTTKVSNG